MRFLVCLLAGLAGGVLGGMGMGGGTVLIPILIITCSSIGCDPRGPIILCSLASMSSLITPMPNPVVPMAMQAGGYTQKTILKVGLVPAVVRGVVGVLIAMTLFPAFG